MVALGDCAGIATAPAAMESTSHVLAHGLDLFYTRVAPAASFDWDDVTSAADRFTIRLLRKMQSLDLPTRHVVPNHVVWNGYRDRLLRRSVDRVGSYGHLVTDRLHGMILGALLDMPVTSEDNSYGKVGRYYAEWFAASDRIEHRVQRRTPPAPSVSRSPASAMGALRENGV